MKTTYPPVLPRFRSRWASAMQLFAMVCLILQPLTVNSYWSDTNADSFNDTWFGSAGSNTLEDLDLQSTDIDGDNATNAEEAEYNSDPFTFDTDGDGLDDGSEIHLAIQQSGKAYSLTAWDSSGDGVSDHDDFYQFFGVTYPGGQLPSFSNASYSDYDGDGQKNPFDAYPADPLNNDADQDGIDDAIDPSTGDSSNLSSANGIAWGSDALGDVDADYTLNFWDAWPYESSNGGPADSDGDGYADDTDPAPGDSSNYSSTNGITWYGSAIADDDTDGTLNFHDTTPYPSGDSDSDGLTDDIDPAPSDSSNYSSTNGMSWHGAALDDADGDGTANFHDSQPYPSGDSDNDGFNDDIDPVPNDYSNPSPNNGQLWYSDVFGDSDGDGTLNFFDHDPWGPPPPTDSDGEGLYDDEEASWGTDNGVQDTDADGLTDYEEVHIYGTSPTNKFHLSQQYGWGDLYTDHQLVDLTDTDFDTIPDRVEHHYAHYGLDINDPADSWRDIDGNGINNRTQYAMGIALDHDMARYDADMDGMSDVFEDFYQLNKSDPDDAVTDPDGDGVTNYEEMVLVLHPHLSDTRGTGNPNAELVLLMASVRYPDPATTPPSDDADNNFIPDWADAVLHTPTVPDYYVFSRINYDDWDGDGMSDVWEHQYGRWRYTNGVQMRVADAQDDHDGDGLTNYGEFLVGTSPIAEDSNADGLLDGDEDFDGDGLSNALEILLGTNPRVYNDMGPPSLSVATTSLPTAQIGSTYQVGLAAQHGSGTYVWTGSGLPPQLSLSSEGTLSGFVDSTLPAGIYSISVTVTDDLGASASATLSLQVVVPPLLLQPAEITLYEGEPFTLGLTATGGIGHSYQIALRGELPSNFWFESGVLGGTATSSSHVIGFTLTDGQTTAERDLMVHVERFEFITAADLPGGCIGQPYSQQITTRGNPAVTTNHALLPGEYIPLGLTLSPGGVLSGTPLEYGVFSFTVQAVKAPAFIPILRTFTLDIKDVGDPDIPGGGTGGGTGGIDDNAPMPDVRLQTQKYEMWNNWALEAPASPPPENSSPEFLKITWPDGEIKQWEGNQPSVYTPVYPTPGSPATEFGFQELHWTSEWQTSSAPPQALTAWNNWVPDLGPLPHELTYIATRVRLDAEAPVPRDYTRQFILHKKDTSSNSNTAVQGTHIETIVVSLTIKKGRKRSSVITMLPRLCEIPPTVQGPGYVHMERASVDSLLPVEVSVPSSISTSMGVDSSAPKPTVSYKPATEVNIATWENSFEHSNPERMVRWWVTNDMDHVRVRIPRPDKIGQGPIKVTIETTNPSTLSEFNDPANEVELTESTPEPGIFENVFLLVSDDVDDNFDGRDETLKDYTHKIAVGGELIIKYEGSEISKLKVKEKGQMKLRPLVLWYHGWFSGYPAVQTSVVQNDVKDIRKRFAQAGIAVDWDGGAWGIDVDNVTGASDSFRDDGMQTLEDAGPTTDERSLSSYITSTYPSIGSKDIVMVYSERLYAPGAWGTGLVGYDQKAYTLIPSFAATKGIRPMIVTTAQRDLHTMAHETLHMVLDDVHPPGHGKHDTEFQFWRRLWSGGIPGWGGGDSNAVTDRKRMSKTEPDYVVPDVQKSPLVQP